MSWEWIKDGGCRWNFVLLLKINAFIGPLRIINSNLLPNKLNKSHLIVGLFFMFPPPSNHTINLVMLTLTSLHIQLQWHNDLWQNFHICRGNQFPLMCVLQCFHIDPKIKINLMNLSSKVISLVNKTRMWLKYCASHQMRHLWLLQNHDKCDNLKD